MLQVRNEIKQVIPATGIKLKKNSTRNYYGSKMAVYMQNKEGLIKPRYFRLSRLGSADHQGSHPYVFSVVFKSKYFTNVDLNTTT